MDNLRGAGLMILAMLGFSFEDMFIKLASDVMPVGQILIMIGIGGALAFGGFALLRGQPPIAPGMLRGPSGIRALLEGAAGLFFVTGLSLVPISIASTIVQASPLLVTCGAALFFGEPVGWRRWTAIAIGLIGVLIVLRPFGEAFEASTLVIVAGVILLSARDLATRRIPAGFTTLQLSTMGFLATIPAGIISLLIAGPGSIRADAQATMYVGGAIAAGIPALYCIIAAMRVGEIGFVAPFRYSRIVFGLTVGVVIFRETLDFYTIVGAAVICAAGLYTFVREARLRRPSPTVAAAL